MLPKGKIAGPLGRPLFLLRIYIYKTFPTLNRHSVHLMDPKYKPGVSLCWSIHRTFPLLQHNSAQDWQLATRYCFMEEGKMDTCSTQKY